MQQGTCIRFLCKERLNKSSREALTYLRPLAALTDEYSYTNRHLDYSLHS